MDSKYIEEQRYLKAKKRVKDIKGFYGHFVTYILVNIFLSTAIILGLMEDNDHTFMEAIRNFGVYSTWIFWGIGVFFHWLGVFGFKNITSKSWEKRKIEELMEKEKRKQEQFTNTNTTKYLN